MIFKIDIRIPISIQINLSGAKLEYPLGNEVLTKPGNEGCSEDKISDKDPSGE